MAASKEEKVDIDKEDDLNESDFVDIEQFLAMDKLRCKLTSDIAVMDQLHQTLPWIPGLDNIRPNEDVLAEKAEYLENMHSYASGKDCIYDTVFGFKTTFNDEGKITIKEEDIEDKKVFGPNKFPYNLDGGCNHHIMWYSDGEHSDDDVSADIDASIKALVKHDLYQFIWYINPKMTVHDIWHVQVFWIADSLVIEGK